MAYSLDFSHCVALVTDASFSSSLSRVDTTALLASGESQFVSRTMVAANDSFVI